LDSIYIPTDVDSIDLESYFDPPGVAKHMLEESSEHPTVKHYKLKL
jgi:hypothetical protein